MRRFCPALILFLIPGFAMGQTMTGVDWQLLAMDGEVIDFNAGLRIEADGSVSGAAPCNRWGARNTATLPDLQLGPVRATRMACDRLADEQVFFASLALMNRMELDGPKNLILSGPDGRSMEFGLASISSLPDCKTCLPKP